MSQTAVITTNDPAQAGTAKTVYILYLVGLLVGITSIIGVIMAYVNRADAPEWVQTHYQMQIRTFWIGLLYFAVGFMTTFIVIGFFICLFALIWWIARCAKGLKTASVGAPYENATTWLW